MSDFLNQFSGENKQKEYSSSPRKESSPNLDLEREEIIKEILENHEFKTLRPKKRGKYEDKIIAEILSELGAFGTDLEEQDTSGANPNAMNEAKPDFVDESYFENANSIEPKDNREFKPTIARNFGPEVANVSQPNIVHMQQAELPNETEPNIVQMQEAELPNETEPNIVHMQEAQPNIAHMQETEPNIVHMQEAQPNIAHMQETQPNIVHMQETEPNIVHMQEAQPNTEHMQEAEVVNEAQANTEHMQEADVPNEAQVSTEHMQEAQPNIVHMQEAEVVNETQPNMEQMQETEVVNETQPNTEHMQEADVADETQTNMNGEIEPVMDNNIEDEVSNDIDMNVLGEPDMTKEVELDTHDLPYQAAPNAAGFLDGFSEPEDLTFPEQAIHGKQMGHGAIEGNHPEHHYPPMPHSKIAAPEHEVVRDKKHHKRKLVRYTIIGICILAALAVAFLIYHFSTRVEVPDFVGTNVSDARHWELTNRISLDITEIYNLEYDEGIIMYQEEAPGSFLRRGNILRVKVSAGADPYELITLPDFEQMNIAQVREWVLEFRMPNVSIREEYDDYVEEGQFLRIEFPDSAVNSDNFTRQDTLFVFMSRGEEVIPADISMPNFVGRTRADVEEWARQHSVNVIFEEEPSNTVEADFIISQSVDPREMISRETTLTVTVSLGILVVVPDFSTMTEEEALAYPNITVIVKKRYNSDILFGHLVSQSEEPGTELLAANAQVILIFSLGRPFIPDLTGQLESVVPEIFFGFTSHGADITYTIVYVDHWATRGEIVSMSRYNDWLPLEAHIYIHVSRGNRSEPTDTPNRPPPPPPDDDYYYYYYYYYI